MLLNCEGLHNWYKDVPRSAKRPTIIGFTILVSWAAAFGSWAAWAPIDGAVVASGAFVATGQNKQLQHLEGGIVRDIVVTEGDLVNINDPLIRLDTTASQARLQRLKIRYFRLKVMRARLNAESRSEDAVVWPEFQLSGDDKSMVQEIIARQQIEFTARRVRARDEVQVLEREIAGLHESILGYKSLIESTRQQVALFKEEIRDKAVLLQRSLARKTEYLALKRSQTRLSGELGQLLSRIGDAHQRIARAEQQIAHLRSTTVQSAIESLRATESEMDDISEQIRAARDIVQRAEVRSPVRGIVVKLNVHTSGGVIAPGAIILELLPVNDDLVIEARVQPSDITHVQNGQAALVRLSALNQRITPMIEGHVVYVSADAVGDPNSRASVLSASNPGSFVVRVELHDENVRSKIPEFKPTPGMPADVFIKTGERTFFDYLLKPVMDSFSRAFREQ